MTTTGEPDLLTARGVCHCKATAFTITSHNLTRGPLFPCSCSFCATGSLDWLVPLRQKLQWDRKGPTTVYNFGHKKIDFEFCTVCGCQISAGEKGKEGTGIFGLNPRLLDVEPWSLETKTDGGKGAGKPPAYKPPTFTGPAFESDTSDKRHIYEGSCHCGDVTFAVRTTPVQEQPVNECNCNFCWRTARVHIYPKAVDVHIGGFENVTHYQTSEPRIALFCKTCGCHLFKAARGEPAKDADGQVVEDALKVLGHDVNIKCVNVRMLHGVNLEDIKVNSSVSKARVDALDATRKKLDGEDPGTYGTDLVSSSEDMPLFALPNEILTIILSFLPASDYLTIKFTCHKLNALTKTTAGHPIRDLRVDFEGNGNAYARVMVSLEGQIERAQHLTSLTCSLCGHCKKLWNGTDGFTDEDFDVTFDGRTCTRCNNAWAFTVRGVAWCHCAFCFTFKQELGVTRREIGKMLKGRLREEVMEDLDWPQDGELICFGCLKETVVESMEVLYMNDTIE